MKFVDKIKKNHFKLTKLRKKAKMQKMVFQFPGQVIIFLRFLQKLYSYFSLKKP